MTEPSGFFRVSIQDSAIGYWLPKEPETRKKALSARDIIYQAANDTIVSNRISEYSLIASRLIDNILALTLDQIRLRQNRYDDQFLTQLRTKKFESLRNELITTRLQIHITTNSTQLIFIYVPIIAIDIIDGILRNYLCKKCGTFIISGNFISHTSKACDTALIEKVMTT
ncbi:MAG TPA: hypothetical protein VIE65_02115 [Methylobacter sp.]|jgi:hypothetical protein